jgi:hypothetical protein
MPQHIQEMPHYRSFEPPPRLPIYANPTIQHRDKFAALLYKHIICPIMFSVLGLALFLYLLPQVCLSVIITVF